MVWLGGLLLYNPISALSIGRIRMTKNTAIIVLTVYMFVSILWILNLINEIEATAVKLTADLNNMKTRVEQVKTQYADMVTKYVQKELEVVELTMQLEYREAQLGQVGFEVGELTRQLEYREAKLGQVEFEAQSANTEISSLIKEIGELTTLAENNKYYFYYTKPEQQYGVQNLATYIRSREWTREYEEGVFDCSEMSAALEWRLENQGFQTIIVVGDSPSNPGVHHAWLLVETSNGKYTPVEATRMSVVFQGTQYYNYNFENDQRVETIQEDMKYSSTRFDRWKSQ